MLQAEEHMENIRPVDFAGLRAGVDGHPQRLLDRASGGTSCQVSCIKTPPASGSPEGLHTHEVDQLFYVLEGTMSIEVSGTLRDAGPGSLIVFPAGIPHRNWNAGHEPTVHLSIAAPMPAEGVPFARPVKA